MKNESTHPSLLSRVRDPADRRAWREFESRYGPLIVGYCRSLGLQLTDAEDVCQDVMISLSHALPGFRYDRDRGRFRSYLGRAVRNAVSRHAARRRARGRPMEAPMLETLAAVDAHAEDALWEAQWMQHHCRRALDTLRREANPQHVAVFDALLAGLDGAEVAARYDVTPAAVRKIKQRLRDRLRAIVARQLRDETGDER